MSEQTSNRIAFTNGQLVDCRKDSCDMTNLIISSGKVMGVGYLPDDDEGTTFYDIGNCLIVPHISDAYLSSDNSTNEKLENNLIRYAITAIGTSQSMQTNCGLRILSFQQPICNLKSDVFSDRDFVFPVDTEFLSVNGDTKRWALGLCPVKELVLAYKQDRNALLRLGSVIQSGLVASLVSGQDSFLTTDNNSVFFHMSYSSSSYICFTN